MKSPTVKIVDLALVWGIASAFGFVAMAVLMLVGGWTLFQGLFAAAILFLVMGTALSLLFLKPLPGPVAAGSAGQQARSQAEATAPAAAVSTAVAGPAPAPAPAPAQSPAPAPQPVAEAPSEDLGEGTRPATLDAPRDGGADNLKRIKGIGPKLETLCHSMGFYHYDQIAAWTEAEVAWVDQNLEGFKGRVVRDDWVAQARALAAGGDTAFSRKVDHGDVY